MWHRFEPALRTAVLRSLEAASARGASMAGAQDLAAGAIQAAPDAHAAKFLQTLISAEGSSDRSGSMVAELAPDALEALEAAYAEGAHAAARQVTIDHLTIALVTKRQAGGESGAQVEQVRRELLASAPVVPPTPGMDEA